MKISCADLATVITGNLFVSVDRLYEIYNGLTGDQLYTHQLPRAFKWCEPIVSRQFPEIAKIMKEKKNAINRDSFLFFLDKWRREFGDSFEVEPIQGWKVRNPLQELDEMMEGRK